MFTLDPTWLPFSNLMLSHIYNVLLICNDYDRFLLEEDGRVEEELYFEYTQLGLSNPPTITFTSSGEEALSLMAERPFDLVIAMLDLGEESVEQLAESIKAQDPSMPVIVLSPSPAHRRNKLIKGSDSPAIDYFFYWQGDPTIFLAMIKLVEDKINLPHDTSVADVQTIILVEDSVRFYSSFLPMIYTCLIQQNRSSILEALNNWGKTLRMRGRPKIVLARTFEEAEEFYERFKENTLGIITDMAYLRRGLYDKRAGLHLVEQISAHNPDIPFLVLSSDLGVKAESEVRGAHFIYKNSSALSAELKRYMANYYGFGPFIFRNPETMQEIGRVETMRELQRTLPSIPEASFAYHFRRNEFSRWLRAQSLYTLANQIKVMQIPVDGDPAAMQKQLIEIIREYRAERTKGVIAQFSPRNYDETLFFSRIGSGSLGGKGRGLAFIDMVLRSAELQQQYPDVYLSIPRTVVLTTDEFTHFIEANVLKEITVGDMSDETLLKIFLSKPLSEELVENLRSIIATIKQPICVRSSSLLEDSHYQPYAGVYMTCMIPNTGSDEQRLKELCDAVRSIWASTYFREAKEYSRATDHLHEDEKMAVIIQQVIGSQHGTYWYPNASGVARSINYYPLGGESPDDGVGMVSFGFGKAVVDAGSALRFSPTFPQRPAHYLGGNQMSSQRSFYALSLEDGFDPTGERGLENLVLLDLAEAEKHPESLKYVASTWDTNSSAFSESTSAEGMKVITFNGILKYNAFPLAPIICDILRLGSQAMGRPVEIEFAVNLNRQAPKKPEFSLLQVRPIAIGSEERDVAISAEEEERAIVSSSTVMGNGNITGISDFIHLKLDSFAQEAMPDMATELEKLNAQMVLEERDYILLVAGRLGSSDPWLGIPVSWSQISRAKVIIETGLQGFQVEPSQGTHFFQNMTSLGAIYFTINPAYQLGSLHLERLGDATVIDETEHFIHRRASEPFTIKANAFAKEGVIV